MNRTDRLYAIREELRRAGAAGRSAERLAATFEVSRRTIKRDISALQQGGFPVRARPGPGGGYVVDAHATLPPMNLTEAELAGLAASVAAHRGQPFDQSARGVLSKALSLMDPPARARAAALTDRVWIDTSDDQGNARVRRSIERALTEMRIVSLTYLDRSGRATTRRVDPVLLAHTSGHWYLVAHCRVAQGLRWFRIDRVTSAHLTTEPASHIPVSSVGEPPATARRLSDV